MDIKKRISAFALALLLSFGVCATDYLEVQALEWAGVTIGLDTALKFLLGLVGVSVGVGVANEIDWTETREQCIQFQQNQGNSAVAVSNWWADVIRGKLDTASDVWEGFKEWVKDELISSSSSSGSGFLVSNVLDSLGVSYSQLDSSILNYEVGSGYYILNNNNIVRVSLFGVGSTFDSFSSNGVLAYYNNFYLDCSVNNFSLSTYNYNIANSSVGLNWRNITKNYIYFYGFGDSDYLSSISSIYKVWDLSNVNVGDNVFIGAFSNVGDIGLGSSIATDLPTEGFLDIPWENIGSSAEAVDGAIDTAIDKVQSGTWSLDQYWEYVQNITNVYAYDITNNYLLPNDGNNETTEDKVQDNVNRSAFVLAGLEKVFPFCIPWDIYAFVNLLVADPVAPVIEYPVYNPVTDSEDIITIDFSVWEQQVIIMRYIFDFLLIIGLLLLARSLIGAGGSD